MAVIMQTFSNRYYVLLIKKNVFGIFHNNNVSITQIGECSELNGGMVA